MSRVIAWKEGCKDAEDEFKNNGLVTDLEPVLQKCEKKYDRNQEVK